ncbi:hypothetical protein BDW22DRAFT_52666 [Trametopsis cervina]|nr:hypothetical protein BDW22DRAFT_52666 [Trametopsis cervina]
MMEVQTSELAPCRPCEHHDVQTEPIFEALLLFSISYLILQPAQGCIPTITPGHASPIPYALPPRENRFLQSVACCRVNREVVHNLHSRLLSLPRAARLGRRCGSLRHASNASTASLCLQLGPTQPHSSCYSPRLSPLHHPCRFRVSVRSQYQLFRDGSGQSSSG